MNFTACSQFRRFMCLLVRQNFSNECENALNQQINLELKASYGYLAMAYHFDRSDVALPGFYGFFKAASDEEREHAQLIMKYMNKRGGKICLFDLPAPAYKMGHPKEALLQALQMEKDVNQSLLDLHALASKHNDPNLCDFLDSHFLQEQVDSQKTLADLIAQMETCDKDLGTYIFDRNLKVIKPH